MLLATSPSSLGAPPNSASAFQYPPSSSSLAPFPGIEETFSPVNYAIKFSGIKQFSGAVAEDFGATRRGFSYSQSLYFVFCLLVLFLVSLFYLLQNFKTQKN